MRIRAFLLAAVLAFGISLGLSGCATDSTATTPAASPATAAPGSKPNDTTYQPAPATPYSSPGGYGGRRY